MDQQEDQHRGEESQYAQRLAKLLEMREEGRDPFLVERYDRTHNCSTITAEENKHWKLPDEERMKLDFSVAGRITALRGKGKVIFADIRDESGKIQIYLKKDEIGEEEFHRFSSLDLGDFIGVHGFPFHTRMGEPSLHITEYTLLSKALRPSPFGKQDEEGHVHGALSDKEQRYRHRHLDLVANPNVREALTRRCRAATAMRRFLDSLGFLEVETPVLQLVAGGAAARPFLTHHNALDYDFKLRISLELYLKRLIIGGYEKVYEIGRVFRNEGISTRHNPEFTMMELYQAYSNLEDIMNLVEKMLEAIAQDVTGGSLLKYKEEIVDLSARPWLRLPILEGIRQYAGIDPAEMTNLQTAKEACKRIDVPFDIDREEMLGGIIEKLHETYTQPHLIQPTFITDFPIETSPLAKKRSDNPALTRRFEIYISTQELGNAFSEINDPLDQRQRFEGQAAMRMAGDEEAHPMDEEFLRAMEYGMPPTGGLGIGIDRLAVILTGAESIRDVLFFPLMRPE